MKILNPGGRWKVEGGNHLSACRLPPSTKRSAFTLIEMIGVMALMAILAAVVVPPLFRTLEEGQRVDEDANLEVIADALVRGIKAYRTFPDPNARPDSTPAGWVTLAKNFYPKGTNALRYVFPKATNWAKTERRVYLDPDFVRFLSNNYAMPASGYTGTLPTNALRMYIVSSSKSDLELACGPNQPGEFMNPAPQDPSTGYGASMVNDLLNWIKIFEGPGSANFGSLMVPQSIARWGDASGGNYKRGEYLHVKIVRLIDLISQVTLEDWHSPLASWTVNPPPTPWNPSSTTPTPLTDGVLSFTWTGSTWTLNAIPRYLSSDFNVVVSGTRNAREISYTTTAGTTKNIRAILPNGPAFALNGGLAVPITDFSPSRVHAFDSTNFFCIKGTVIQLYNNLSPRTLQNSVILNRDYHYQAFTGGVWVDADL